MIIAGVCLLVILTIAECRFDFSITASAKQVDDCGDVNDNSTKLGQCTEAAIDYDYDYICDEGCVDVLVDYLDCIGFTDYYDIDDDPCDAVTVTAISTVTAILVAIAAALN